MKSLVTLFGLVTLLATADSAASRTIHLLDGKLSLEVSRDLLEKSKQSKSDARYVKVTSLESPDRRLSVLVTYGKHIMKASDLQPFLDYKVSSYSKLKARHPRFRWLEHALVERDGREWAEVRFVHDISSPIGTDVYTRCISSVVDGHLLEIWVLTRAPRDPAQKAAVDKIIDSVQIAR
jgi:hypothetical protein